MHNWRFLFLLSLALVNCSQFPIAGAGAKQERKEHSSTVVSVDCGTLQAA